MGSLQSPTLGTHVVSISGVSADPVEPAAAVADAAALTSVAAEGDTPTADEFDAVVADLTEVRAQLNGLLASLRDAGVLDS